MTLMTTFPGTAIVMLEVVLSAMHGAYPRQRTASPGPHRYRRTVTAAPSPLQDVRGPSGAEVTNVDALGNADPDLPDERLMHMAKQDIPRLCSPYRREQRLAAPFHPPRHRVEEQLRHSRRDMRTEHVDRSDRLDLGRVHLVIQLVGRPVRGAQPASDEAEGPPAELEPLAIQDLLTRPQIIRPQRGQIDVSVRQVGRHGQRREELGVLAARGGLDMIPPITAQLLPQSRRHRPGFVEALGRPQPDEFPRGLRSEQLGKDALARFGVIDEQQQVTQAEKGICTVGRAAESPGVPVHIADYVDPHAQHTRHGSSHPDSRTADTGNCAPPGLGSGGLSVVTSRKICTKRGQQRSPVREYGMPALVEVSPSTSLADVVFRRAETKPAAVVLRRRTSAGSWQDVTAEQFGAEVAALAKALIAAGVESGNRIALMSRTRYEWTLIDYAIWAAGAVTVPIYETSSAEQVEWILGDSCARAVFAEASQHEKIIASVRDRLPDLRDIWLIDGLDALSSAGEQIGGDQLSRRRDAVMAADLATIIYTSGTTGRPKGCELTHANMISTVRNAVQGALPQLFEIPSPSTLLFLPLAHSFARIIQVACLESGAVLGHWPDATTLAQGLPEFGPTFLLAVPRVFEKVYNGAQQQAAASTAKARIFAAAAQTAVAWSTASDSADGHRPGPALRLRHALFDRLVYAKLRTAVGGSVQYAVSGGAPLGDRLGHFFAGAGITVLEGYGLTETAAAIAVNKPTRNKIGTVGQPLAGVTVRIADDGEILIKGPNVFPGYWRNDAATAAALDCGGWLHTGDIGTLDDEGFLRVTGRKKEIIVTAGGKNVAPAVLEDRIRAHPLVSQCMVVGDARPYVACLVTLDPEGLEFWKKQHGRPADTTLGDLVSDPGLIADIQLAVDDANKAVSRAESIRRFRVLSTDFTESTGHLTPSLKVRRNVVAEDFTADIEALYS